MAASGDKGESSWSPNDELLTMLLSMGIKEKDALEGLFCTNNKSVEDAVNFIFNNDTKPVDSNESDEEVPKSYKMTFVVNSNLKMGVGKLAAQVAHACIELYRKLAEKDAMMEELCAWEFVGEKKVVLRGNDHNHLLELYAKAQEASIPCFLIRDAGRTQIPPDSITVLSLFGLEEQIDTITGKLCLL